MGHLVITIGCEYGAKGNAIGRKIAEDLGIKFYDRDLVDQIIEEVGIPKDIMNRVEEGGTIAGKGAEGDVRGSFSKYADLTERAIHVQKQIIRKLAEKEACVIIGRSADYILKDSKDIKLLRAFIYAPDEIRIQNIMKSHSLSESDAKILLLEKDKRYHKRHLALTGSNRGDRQQPRRPAQPRHSDQQCIPWCGGHSGVSRGTDSEEIRKRGGISHGTEKIRI